MSAIHSIIRRIYIFSVYRCPETILEKQYFLSNNRVPPSHTEQLNEVKWPQCSNQTMRFGTSAKKQH